MSDISDAAPHDRSHTAEVVLTRELERIRQVHTDRSADPRLAKALERIADWQAARLSQTYADLSLQPRYRDAIAFFQTDLYGGANFAQRDADLARIVPLL